MSELRKMNLMKKSIKTILLNLIKLLLKKVSILKINSNFLLFCNILKSKNKLIIVTIF